MFRLGYLDDDKGIRTTFARLFEKDFEIFIFKDMDRISSLEDLLNVLEEEHLDALAVDYLLSGNGVLPYNGDEVVSYMENRKKFFPVFMVTSHVGDALDKMYDVFLVNDKEDLSDEKQRLNLIDKVKKAVGSYHRKVNSIEEKARELEVKQKSEVGLTNEEEQFLLKLHMELNSIDPKANPISARKAKDKFFERFGGIGQEFTNIIRFYKIDNMLFREICPKRSTNVPIYKDYAKYRQQLSEDFNHRCGYCNDLDWPRKEYFEIDHFVPKDVMVDLKDNEYSNLVYACRSCNNAKRAKWPSGDENLSYVDNKGWLDPCSEEYGEQFERTEDGAIIPKTELGKWMYDNLKLGKTQHEYLWNIEQLKKICDALKMKREEHRDDIVFMNKFTDLLLAYTDKIEELGK